MSPVRETDAEQNITEVSSSSLTEAEEKGETVEMGKDSSKSGSEPDNALSDGAAGAESRESSPNSGASSPQAHSHADQENEPDAEAEAQEDSRSRSVDERSGPEPEPEIPVMAKEQGEHEDAMVAALEKKEEDEEEDELPTEETPVDSEVVTERFVAAPIVSIVGRSVHFHVEHCNSSGPTTAGVDADADAETHTEEAAAGVTSRSRDVPL